MGRETRGQAQGRNGPKDGDVADALLQVQVDAPQVGALGVVGDDALKDRAAALHLAKLELHLRKLADRLDVCAPSPSVVPPLPRREPLAPPSSAHARIDACVSVRLRLGRLLSARCSTLRAPSASDSWRSRNIPYCVHTC